MGLYTITFLAELEKYMHKPIASAFDLIAGTSIGGIIALALAEEIPASEIKKIIEDNGTYIFSKRPSQNTTIRQFIDVARSIVSAKYSNQNLKKIMKELFENRKIGELKHRVIVPAVNLSKGQPQLFKTPHHPSLYRDQHLSIADVCVAISAAPTYFPISEIEDELFADGGLFANSPDILALHEAQYFLKQNIEYIKMLSIGTTTAKYSFAHESGLDMGSFNWLRGQRLTNVILAAQQQSVDYMMKHCLGDRYIRIDAIQSKEQERHIALDVATMEAQKNIRALAIGSVQSAISDYRLQEILKNIAPRPKFFNKEGEL